MPSPDRILYAAHVYRCRRRGDHITRQGRYATAIASHGDESMGGPLNSLSLWRVIEPCAPGQ